MADIEYGETVGEVYPSHGFSLVGFMNFLGAIISVALIAGLAWWGYQLMVRDVSGVPVVRALEGPMRIAPDDPGGKSADYQGLAVNNIAAVGEAADPADRLELAPKPTALLEEDMTVGELDAMEIVAAPAEGLVADDADMEEMTTSNAEADEPIVEDRASIIEAALLMVQQPEAQPLSATIASDAATEQSVASILLDDVIPASVAGVSRSLIPQVRPATLVASLATAAVMTDATDAGTQTIATVDPAAIATGTRLVQLGAFPSPEEAKAEWAALDVKFEEFMDGKSQVIQRAQSGGKVFYRLRAYGFEDLSDARRFCSALLAGKANCIPVVTR